MSRIMQAWETLLRDAISGDYDEQQYALFQIGLVLQRHNPHSTPDSAIHEETLSRELLRLTLNEQRQSDTVTYLAELVKKHPKHAASFLYAMGNAQPRILIEPLLTLLQAIGATLNTNAAYQALLALDGALRHRGDEVASTLREYDICGLLEEWADSEDDIVAEKARKIRGI